MKRKGFTLVELLVVISIIALLMAILLPALGRVRQVAFRMLCGTNLAGIGKAMVIYGSDNFEDYPKAGRVIDTTWIGDKIIGDWDKEKRRDAFSAEATITSSLYLLIRYADVTPDQFVCKGDAGTKVFKLSATEIADEADIALEDVWDFGGGKGGSSPDYPMPGQFCSYAYHIPYYKRRGVKGYPINSTDAPDSPLCADRNPYLDKNAEKYRDWNDPDDPEPTCEQGVFKDLGRTMNAAAHQREGQTVLFNDSHVSFEKHPNVGIEKDNIYKYWTSPEPDECERQFGTLIPQGYKNGDWGPQSKEDAWLVGEGNHDDYY